MSYNLDIGAREEIVKKTTLKKDSINISLARKLFQADNLRFSVLFEDGMKEQQILELMLYHQIKHVMQNSIQPAEQKLQMLNKISQQPSTFFENSTGILPDESIKMDLEFNHATKKDEIFHKFNSFAGIDPNSTRSQRIMQTLEEMISNAQLYIPPNMIKDPNNTCHLKVELLENLIAISVLDPYGTLDTKKFLKKIEAGVALGIGQAINMGKGGAGVGSSLIFKHCDSLWLGVRQGRKTRVSIVMPYIVRDRVFDELQKSVHII